MTARPTAAPAQPRGGHAFQYRVGSVSVRIALGHLDHMPRCQACGRALCSHTDAEFIGHPLEP